MRQQSLGRAAGDLVGFVQFFRDAPDSMRPSAPDLRSRLMGLLDAFTGSTAGRSVDPAELEAARFALVAWADETILRSTWPGREDWVHDLLQTTLFGTNKGGDEYYNRLAALPPDFNQAREVYMLGLAMGFEGRLVGDDAARQELMRQQYEMLRVSGLAVDSAAVRHLSEPAYQLAIEVHGGSGRSLMPVVATWVVGTLVGFGLLYLTLWLLAGGVDTPPEL